jgi:hypothetical protein
MKLIDNLRDLPWLAGLWLFDKLADPEPETEADRVNARVREARREQLGRAGLLPEIPIGPLVPIPGEWYFGIPCRRCGERVALLPDASRGQGPVVYRGSRWRLYRRRCPRGHLMLYRLRALRRFQWLPAK